VKNNFPLFLISKIIFWTVLLCPSAIAQEVPKLNIAVVMPLSGAQQVYGEEAFKGIIVAAEYYAGVEPKIATNIQLTKHDDKSQAKTAGELAQTLYGKNRIHIIIGSISSAATSEISKYAVEFKRPLISPLASNGDLTQDGYVYRVSTSAAFQSETMGRFAKNKLKLKKVAFLSEDSPIAKQSTKHFSKFFVSGTTKIVASENHDYGETDFSQALTKFKKLGVQAIFIPSQAPSAAKIIRQAKTLGLKTLFLGLDSWDTPTITKLDTKGIYFTSQYTQEPGDKIQEYFVTKFRELYGRAPGTIAALAFDSYLLAADVLKHSSSTLHEPLNRAFQRTEGFKGVTGLLSFSKNEANIKSSFIKKAVQGQSNLFDVVIPSEITVRTADK